MTYFPFEHYQTVLPTFTEQYLSSHLTLSRKADKCMVFFSLSQNRKYSFNRSFKLTNSPLLLLHYDLMVHYTRKTFPHLVTVFFNLLTACTMHVSCNIRTLRHQLAGERLCF